MLAVIQRECSYITSSWHQTLLSHINHKFIGNNSGICVQACADFAFDAATVPNDLGGVKHAVRIHSAICTNVVILAPHAVP